MSSKQVGQGSTGNPGSTWRRLRRWGVSLVVAAAMLTLPSTAMAAPADSPPPTAPLEQLQALVQPAVVYEQIIWTGYVYDETNKGYFTDEPFTVSYQCTGFVVNPDGYVGTAGHCVDYDRTVQDAILSQVVDWAYENDYYEATPSRETIATFARNWRVDGADSEGVPDLSVSVAYGVSVSGEPTGKELTARVVAVRPPGQGDVALLKIEAENLTVVPLSDNSDTGVGTEVVAVGYPVSVDLVTDVDFNPSFKEGTISAKKTTDAGSLQVYEISAAVSGGMSGGPTVGLDGDVVGVNSFGITDEPQPFNFVQPAQTLEEMLRGEGVQNELGSVTEQYRAGLDAYFAGDRDAAIEDFDAVLQVVPSHQFAQEYLQKTQALPAASTSPMLWVLLGAAALLVLGLIGLAVWARRRRAGGTPPPQVPAAAPAGAPFAGSTPVVEAEPVAPAPTSTLSRPETGADSTPAAPPESSAPDDERFCPNCGKQHEPDAHFCSRCGQAL